MQTELHRHLDVSVRTSTLLELAQTKGIEAQSTSLESFREKLLLRKPLKDLSSVLATFELFPRLLDRPEVLERVGFEAVEDCYLEGTRQVELRFSPSFVTEFSKLSWEEALSGFERGIARARKAYPDIKTGLICIASRDFGADAAKQTVEFFLKNQQRFVGVDLAGNEVAFPCRMFEDAFRRVRESGANITIHAGEGEGPENMWEAIELLGAKRIGHGLACIQDPQLMTHHKDRGICLEMCPTSNWITQATKTLETHPLPKVLRAGIPVCINTDDPGIFGVTLPHEKQIAFKSMGLTNVDLERCETYAAQASFIP